jgi:hypothetical protein
LINDSIGFGLGFGLGLGLLLRTFVVAAASAAAATATAAAVALVVTVAVGACRACRSVLGVLHIDILGASATRLADTGLFLLAILLWFLIGSFAAGGLP